MPQTNIQVVDDNNEQKTLDQIATTLNALQEHLRIRKEKRATNGRAVLAPEAIESPKDAIADFSKAPLRDIMRQSS
jgi:hypothetical protein